MKNIKTSHIVTVENLVAMTIEMQPRMISDHDLKDNVTYLNECVHCQNASLHVPANWTVTYASIEVIAFPKPFMVVKRGAITEGVCNGHIKDVMENIRDYYQASFEELALAQKKAGKS